RINGSNSFAVYLHQKPPFPVIDTSSGANGAVNVNLHSIDGSFQSSVPPSTLASAKRHIEMGLPRWVPVRLSAGYRTNLFLSTIRPLCALWRFLITSIVQDPLEPPPSP